MKRWRFATIGLLIIAGVVIATSPAAMASNYGRGTYGSCQYNSCSISITSIGTVNLNLTPTSSGKCTIASDTVGVLTDNSNGYNLTIASSTTSSNLANGSDTIPTSSATFASPATLSLSSWGYRVDNLGSFGAGPTSAVSSGPLSSLTFAGIPTSLQTPHILANTAVAANPVVNTIVWYGICTDTSVTSGSYLTTVTYTAVTND